MSAAELLLATQLEDAGIIFEAGRGNEAGEGSMKRPHWLRHILSLTCGECCDRGFMAGWAMRRDIELRQRNLPASPDEMDRWLRRVIAESERYEGAA